MPKENWTDTAHVKYFNAIDQCAPILATTSGLFEPPDWQAVGQKANSNSPVTSSAQLAKLAAVGRRTEWQAKCSQNELHALHQLSTHFIKHNKSPTAAAAAATTKTRLRPHVRQRPSEAEGGTKKNHLQICSETCMPFGKLLIHTINQVSEEGTSNWKWPCRLWGYTRLAHTLHSLCVAAAKLFRSVIFMEGIKQLNKSDDII